MEDQKYILAINAGSATLKFKIFEKKSLQEELVGRVERIGLKNSFFVFCKRGCKEFRIDYPKGVKNHLRALKLISDQLLLEDYKIEIIGHRVVHGGDEFVEPTLITKRVLQKLEKYSLWAPLHNPVNLACIRGCIKIWSGVRNIAVFDTMFFSSLKPEAYLYALPYKFYTKYRIRKYGFHGISHQYVAETAAKKLKKDLSELNLISLHLGSGCSITAIKRGKTIETSMGFSALPGLVMGTRAGDLDPEILIYLKKIGMSFAKMNQFLHRECGLKGLSGFTSDMRDILLAAGHKVAGYESDRIFTAEQKQRAELTLDVFIYKIKQYIYQYLGLLEKVDAIIFTAGIGERNTTIRKLILKDLPKVKNLVIATNEELMIAKMCRKF